MKINIETIPHEKQRYPTVGDWWWDNDGTIQIRVSEMYNEKYEFLVALHECVEIMLCKERGITEEEVSDFDIKFEAEREMKQHSEEDEPGDDDRAPYKSEHFFATNIERQMALELDVDWNQYDSAVVSL